MTVQISPEVLPSQVDLRNKFNFVYDQGQLGSCTANAISALVRFRNPEFNPSRLFIYYNERNMEGTITSDSGASLQDGVRSLDQYGVCSELAWSYNIKRFAEQPPSPCYKLALDHRYTKSYNIDNTDIQQIKTSLFHNNPFVLGIAVYESFESEQVASTGIVPMPKSDEKLQGGHAIICVGYNDEQQRVICLNSWSSSWGDKGYFHLPYEFITNTDLTSDAWSFDL